MPNTAVLEPTIEQTESANWVAYRREGNQIAREVRIPIGSSLSYLDGRVDTGSVDRDWFLSRMRGAVPTTAKAPQGRIRTVDLFSGAGGLSLGTSWAIEAVGKVHKPLLAADMDQDALDVHKYNLLPKRSYSGSVRDLLDPTPLLNARDPKDVAPSSTFVAPWLQELGPADIVIGGPPCQGHSNLNNRTRRKDVRNELYLWMAVAAHAFRAKLLVVENVVTVKADAGYVVARTLELLERLGYRVVVDDVLAADQLGVAQTRRRHFLVAVREDVASADLFAARDWLKTQRVTTPNLMHTIEDLQDFSGRSRFDSPSNLSPENQARVEWLHRNDAYDLPDSERPACHRDKAHNYGSVYGRLYPEAPSGTLSTGFLTPGRGRYVHPTRRRTMTPHEGARVQGFPDDFRFLGASGNEPARTALARLIGDAVPPPMAFHVILAALAMLAQDS